MEPISLPRKALRFGWRVVRALLRPAYGWYRRWVATPVNMRRNARKSVRRLEIGPGATRIPGFETVNVVAGRHVDYVLDANQRLPFADGSFDEIIASHVLEHFPWHSVRDVVTDWVRLLKPTGTLEIWVPDGYKLAQLLCDIEEGRPRSEWQDGWRPRCDVSDPHRWVNGRLLYGMRDDYPSWHRAILTPALLRNELGLAGLTEIEQLEDCHSRATRHGWINLGMRGRKP